MRRAIGVAMAVCLLAACSGGDGASIDSAEVRGEKIYKNVCVTCHGPDPNQDGTIGPAIAGSSVELVEAKLLRGEYPPGYAPRRQTQLMAPLPHLKDYVPDLAAYLQSVQPATGG